jgi:hypothetical protein
LGKEIRSLVKIISLFSMRKTEVGDDASWWVAVCMSCHTVEFSTGAIWILGKT